MWMLQKRAKSLCVLALLSLAGLGALGWLNYRMRYGNGRTVLAFGSSISALAVAHNGMVAAVGEDAPYGERYLQTFERMGGRKQYPPFENGELSNSQIWFASDSKTLIEIDYDAEGSLLYERPFAVAPHGAGGLFGGSGLLRCYIPLLKVVEGSKLQTSSFSYTPDEKSVLVIRNGVVSKSKAARGGVLELRDLLHAINFDYVGRLSRYLELPPLQGKEPQIWNAPAWSADLRHIAVANNTGSVYLWDVATGKILGQIASSPDKSTTTVQAGNIMTALAFAPDGRVLAVGRSDGSIAIYSLKTWLPVADVVTATSTAATTAYGAAPVRCLAWSPDGATLYSVVQSDRRVQAWNVPRLTD